MNGRDDEVWLDTLLQRLPPRERPVRRAFILGLTCLVAAATLLLPTGEGSVVLSSTDAGSLAVPCCLGTALLWYLVDRLT